MGIESGKVKSLDREVFYEGSIGEFAQEQVELPDGRTIRLAILHHPGAAAVLPFVDDDNVVLIRQYRHAAGGVLWEIPAGKLDAGEVPEQCALRELQEETGYQATQVTALGQIFTTPGFTDEVIHLYMATGLQAGAQQLDGDEWLEVHVVPFEAALQMVQKGEITDAKTVCALLYAARQLGR